MWDVFDSSVHSSDERHADGLALIYNLYLSPLAFLVEHTAEFSYILLITGDLIWEIEPSC